MSGRTRVNMPAQLQIARPGRGERSTRPAPLRAHQLPALIAEGETVVIGHGGGWPRRAVEELVQNAEVPFQILHNRIDDHLPYFNETVRHVRHVGLMVGRETRAHIRAGTADYIPNSYGSTPALIRSGAIPCDVVILHVTPPDANGWCSLGTCSAYLPAAVERARLVIAQMNPQMPRTHGTCVHVSSLDCVIEVDEPLQAVNAPRVNDVTAKIAANIASLIADGDVIQIGIGKLGDAVLAALIGKKNLRLWTETFSDSAIALLRNGALAIGSPRDPAITATFVTGSAELYQAIHDDPAISILPVDLVNAPARLAAVPRLTAINSAIQIDLTGQVNAESIGNSIYSGSGGHLDFAVGANSAPDGRYICAIPSLAGQASRIVSTLPHGSAVTVPRSLAGIVVTEHGIADLRGKSLHARAEALIGIAHPDHRSALADAAKSVER